jgi:hypothetical protein
LIVQWCCKGIGGIEPAEVRTILTSQAGLRCRLWQLLEPLPYDQAVERLTERDLDLHVNHYDAVDARSGKEVRDQTPFISLSAGCVDRNSLRKKHVLHPALRTALAFATDLGRRPGWVFTCYVLTSVNRAEAVPGVAEEVRDLNQQRKYSEYWLEGEIAAKINVPSRQILCAERWELIGGSFRCSGGFRNLEFVHPEALLDMRQML